MTTPTVRGTRTGAGTHRMRGVPALVVLACALPAHAQDTARAAPQTVPVHAPTQDNLQASYDTSFFSGLRWRNIGPERGGRSIAAAGSTARPLEYWFGATGGGVWKTTDGGKTWTHVGLRETHAIGRIRVHPADCDRVLVAALGHPYGPHPERGVFRSTDGGATWQKTLFRGENAGAVDLVMTPGAPDTVFASLWEVFRTPWSLSSGGPGSGLFRSTDGGATWTEITTSPGLPTGTLGKIGVSVSGANPSRVFAIIEAAEGGVFRSDDGGATWTRLNDERKLRQRAFYYTRIYADPRDTSTVYVLNVAFWKSTDGGRTFPRAIRVPHGDNHDLWIDPANPQRMIEANDGGANVTVNGGESWTDQDYPTAQMYHVITTRHLPYHVCGAQQDNSTACVPSDGNGRTWYAVGGGESGYIASRPDQPDVFFAGSYGGLLTRFDRRTGERRNVNVWPENPMGHSSRDIRERFQWTFPIVISPHDPNVLYVGSQHLWRSTDQGSSWERISPNLTRSDPATLGPSGGPITLDQTGVETYGTLFTIAPSPLEAGTIWTGSDDGRVHVTRDGGGTWTDVTPPELGDFSRISLIEASPHAAGRAYVAANRYQQDDRAPYAWRTDDYGRTWTRITRGIAADDFLRAVREDPQRPRLLYAGTEHGVYVSWDDGAGWQSLRLNLPDVQVADLVVERNDLVIGTHGRSFYVLDDIAPLRQMTPEVAASRQAHLFRPADAARAMDPGVAVYYTLAAPAQRVTLEFLDARGNVIRTFTGVPADSARRAGAGGGGEDDDDQPAAVADPRVPLRTGLNRFVWNLRHPGPESFPGIVLWAARLQGPRALPGAYRVRLTVDGRAQTQDFRILPDPRGTATSAELEAQFALAMRVRDRTSDANRGVIRIRGIRAQVQDRLSRTEDPAIRALADSVLARLAAVENELYQTRLQANQDPLNYPIRLNNKLAALAGVIESAEAAPTRQTYQVLDELSARLDVQLAALNAVVAGDLPRLNARLRARRLRPIDPDLPPPPADERRPGADDEAEEEEEEEEEEARDW